MNDLMRLPAVLALAALLIAPTGARAGWLGRLAGNPPQLAPVPALTSATSVVASGTALAGTQVRIYEAGQVVGTAAIAADRTFAATVGSLAEGAHSLTAVAVRSGIETAPSNVVSFTVDRTPPAAPRITSPAAGAVLAPGAASVAGSAEAGATVTVAVNGVVAGAATADAAGAFAVEVSLPAGTATLTAVARDAAGNLGAVSAGVGLTVSAPAADPAPPPAPAPLAIDDAQSVRDASYVTTTSASATVRTTQPGDLLVAVCSYNADVDQGATAPVATISSTGAPAWTAQPAASYLPATDNNLRIQVYTATAPVVGANTVTWSPGTSGLVRKGITVYAFRNAARLGAAVKAGSFPSAPLAVSLVPQATGSTVVMGGVINTSDAQTFSTTTLVSTAPGGMNWSGHRCGTVAGQPLVVGASAPNVATFAAAVALEIVGGGASDPIAPAPAPVPAPIVSPAPAPTPTPAPAPIVSPAPAPGATFPPDTTMVRFAQPSIAEPAQGASIANVFGTLSSAYDTTTTRVTSSVHQYAKDQVWNADETLVMTNDGNVYDGATYAALRTCPRVSEHDTWSNVDPRYVYGANRDERQWVRTDVTTCAMTVLKTYSAADVGLASLSSTSFGEYEGNLDNADTGAVLVANGVRPFLVDPRTGAVRCVVTSGGGYGSSVSDATMSQDGRTILVNWSGYGIDAYDAATCRFARKLTGRNSHYDACVSAAGEQVIVQPLWTSGANLGMVRISDGAVTEIFRDSDLREHLSCRNLKRPGWVYMSHEHNTCDSSVQGMASYHRIFAIKLDGSATVENFAWDHQACPAPYEDNPMAVPSPTGDRVWWKGRWDSSSAPLHSFVSRR